MLHYQNFSFCNLKSVKQIVIFDGSALPKRDRSIHKRMVGHPRLLVELFQPMGKMLLKVISKLVNYFNIIFEFVPGFKLQINHPATTNKTLSKACYLRACMTKMERL